MNCGSFIFWPIYSIRKSLIAEVPASCDVLLLGSSISMILFERSFGLRQKKTTNG